MSEKSPLELTFDPQTVDHLGAKMYSHLPNAIAELVANAYDADAKVVEIRLAADGKLSITDDGHGMSRQDVADKYLHIGRNRRAETASQLTESGKRSVSGKKGLGKLALFGIGKRIEVITTREGETDATVVVLSYSDMMASKGVYRPVEKSSKQPAGKHGTVVRLSELKRKTPIDASDLARSLARLFNYADSDFRVTVIAADGSAIGVDSKLRIDAVRTEFEWRFPAEWTDKDDAYGREHDIDGIVISSSIPLRQGQRGVTLYVHGRLASEPEFFGASESSFAFSYLTGFLNVDYLDQLEPDVIATDRRAIDWDTDETRMLQEQLQRLMLRIGQEWRVKRAELRKRENETLLGGSTTEWVSSIRADEQGKVRDLIDAIESDDIDITVDQQGELLQLVKKVAPPHAEYVWRHLHPQIQAATERYYVEQDYYMAVQEAIKRYVSLAKQISGVDASEATGIVVQAFGEKGRLSVFNRYMVKGGFDIQTEKNVEEGQKHVSMGIVAGFRNPLAHEEIEKLQTSGAFTNDDCLDALSIISHLMRRLSTAELSAK